MARRSRTSRLASPAGAALVALLVALVVSAGHGNYRPAVPPLQIQERPAAYPFTFIAYGDIRFTGPADHEHSDPDRRQALVRQIAAEHPAFLMIDGDIVYNGGHAADWQEYDRETGPWRDAKLQIFPVLGNHDVRGGPDALPNYFAHFPQLQEHRWYSVRYGNCLLLVLDSDTDHSAGSDQGKWLAQQLGHVPRDVDFVFVALHHPPYTKSSDETGGHDVRGSEQQLAAMLERRAPAMRQKIVVIAGHVHNYERYLHGGVMYIVSGGGGAEPYPIARGPQDFYRAGGPTYHYCTFTVDRGHLRFEMHKQTMQGPTAQYSVEDSFELSTAK